MAAAKVTWEQWIETWRHVSAGGFGVYEPRERAFQSRDEARGFDEALRCNPYVRNVRTEGR